MVEKAPASPNEPVVVSGRAFLEMTDDELRVLAREIVDKVNNRAEKRSQTARIPRPKNEPSSPH